ncbi:unnamed protein product [Symbiodinium sp. CCMP2592]|nr:unnamed protein product [Symbiodinium sp. CCMP2592]
MATSVIIRDVAGYAAPAAPPAQRESQSFSSSGEYYMVLSSGEQEQNSAAVNAPTLEEKLAAYQARKERKRQQRQRKTSMASEKRQMFNREMEKTYTEQQAMEELLHDPPSKDSPWGPAVERYLSSASESSMCSQSSVNSVVHEQVALVYSGCKSATRGDGSGGVGCISVIATMVHGLIHNAQCSSFLCMSCRALPRWKHISLIWHAHPRGKVKSHNIS